MRLLKLITMLLRITAPACAEHPPLAQAKTQILTSRSAKSDARNAPNTPQIPQEPDLALVVERWPELPKHIKAAIKALAQTSIKEKK